MKTVKTIDEKGVTRYRHPETGKLHRTTGPAYIHPKGSEIWFLNGERHRIDGPTWFHPDGHRNWCAKDKSRHQTTIPKSSLYVYCHENH